MRAQGKGKRVREGEGDRQGWELGEGEAKGKAVQRDISKICGEEGRERQAQNEKRIRVETRVGPCNMPSALCARPVRLTGGTGT